MTRIPQIQPDDMNAEQRRVYDDVMASTGRSGGPSIGYAYAPGLWEASNRVSDHLGDCSLSQAQVRIAALTAARYWNSAFPFAVQVPQAFAAGVAPAIVDAINDRERPEFASPEDEAVYDVAQELLASGTLGDDGFTKAAEILGHTRLVDTVGAVGQFCKVCMMANTVGAVPPETAPVKLKP
jgi:4-carboxymuconolactone decarboxylase